jgi:UDP-3-O-[3-hydroxymyristoyl] N-acetylglucosamine deacetylase
LSCKKSYFQNTIKTKASISGVGLFTGAKVKMSLLPASEDSGVVFRRIDLSDKPILPAKLEFVEETDRTTFVGFGKKRIETVEHILSTLAAYKIDNLLIEVDGPEIPIMDGSSKKFAELIEKVGVKKQSKEAKIWTLDQPVSFTENYINIIALPSDDYKITFILHHPKNEILRTQYYSYLVDEKTYLKEIAPSRTYSVYEEIKPLLDNNLIKGGSLENAVLIKDNEVVNSEGIRFPDEMVRHKILDLMGDFFLIGKRFNAHIIAIRSGHLINVKFAKKLIKYLLKECKN